MSLYYAVEGVKDELVRIDFEISNIIDKLDAVDGNESQEDLLEIIENAASRLQDIRGDIDQGERGNGSEKGLVECQNMELEKQ